MAKPNKKQSAALLAAADNGDLSKLKQALSGGADVNATTDKYLDEQMTPLMVAAAGNYFDCVQEFIRAGADVNAKTTCEQTSDRDGGTVLHALFLADDADPRILGALVDAGAEIDAQTKSGETPLARAAARGNLACVKVLLDHGSKAHLLAGKRETAILCAARSGNRDVVELLLRHGTPVDILNDFNMTALIGASGKPALAVVEVLLDHHASVNLADNRRRTALHHVCDRSNRLRAGEMSHVLEIARRLVKAGADLSAKDQDGLTPVQLVEAERAPELKQWLSAQK